MSKIRTNEQKQMKKQLKALIKRIGWAQFADISTAELGIYSPDLYQVYLEVKFAYQFQRGA
jgi:hypothetical protein